MPRFFDQWVNKPSKPKLVTPNPVFTKVQQHYKDQLEINNIIRRASNGGFIPPPSSEAMYLDMTCTDLMEASSIVERAKIAFSNLPSDVRVRFDNDPIKACQWLSDDRNYQSAIEFGMRPKPAPVPQSPAPVPQSPAPVPQSPADGVK